ncbi:hypothetical protein HDU96_000710 [Phlyctochytrium bullatum]|nr:hypothetical protein HDU96_000710 [Phlyctochytrium bullatum]
MNILPHGSRTIVARPDQMHMRDFEDLTLTTPDGVKIKGYAIRNTLPRAFVGMSPTDSLNSELYGSGMRYRGGISSDGIADCTLLYLHANAGNMGHRLPIANVFYYRLHCNVFMLSYRGYGLSEGEPNEKGIKIDAQTALDWITNHPQYGKTKIIVYGQSIGGAVAIDLVRRNPKKVAALIVENTFLSIRKLIPHVMPIATYFTFLCHQIWDSETAISEIPKDVPILFLSGKKDELIPQKHMLGLAAVAKAARRGEKAKAAPVKEKAEPADEVVNLFWDEFAEGMHNDTCVQDGYFDAIERFWRSKVSAGSSSS